MFDKNFFEKAYKIGEHSISLGEYAVVHLDEYHFDDNGIEFIFGTSIKDGNVYRSENRSVYFSYEEFMRMSVEEIFERFTVVEDELEEIFRKYL